MRYWYDIGSMRRLTPFFCMTVSSSLATSSNVNPYCRPEQPPPVTNTRSFSSSLPSSSISAFTLLAALSVKISGSGIAVLMSFMLVSPVCSSIRGARCGLELHHLVAARGCFVDQLPHHDRADVDLDRLVGHISCDTGLGEEFDILGRAHRSRDGAVDDHVRDVNLALDLRQLGNDQRAGLVARGAHVALHVAVDTQTAREAHVTFDGGPGTDETVDGTGFVGLPEHVPPYGKLIVLDSLTCPPGTARTRTSTLFSVPPSGMRKRPSTLW